MRDGLLHLFYWRKVPVRLHWSVLVMVAYAVLSGRSPFELLGGGIVILVHELGHAVLVQRYRLRVLEILIHPFGGECIHEATENKRQRVVIAWGGVLAQAALFVLALALTELGFLMRIAPLREVLLVLIGYNVFVAVFNLLPIRPLDGHTAWQLKHLRRSAPSRPDRKKRVSKLRPISRVERQELDAVIDTALEEARSQAGSRDDEHG